MGVVAVGKGVYRIPTAGDFINSFAFVEDDGSVTLVDTGTRLATKRIVNGLASFGKHPRDVQRIILTHAHSDHAGSAARLLPHTRATGAYVHVDDADQRDAGDVQTCGDGQVVHDVPSRAWFGDRSIDVGRIGIGSRGPNLNLSGAESD